MCKKESGLASSCALIFFLLGGTAIAASPPVRVPFEYAKERNTILIQAQVNHRPALLILDTGAAHTILRPGFLGIPQEELQRSRHSPQGGGVLGDAIGAEVALEIGSGKWPKVRVAVMDLDELLSVYSEKIDGLLGLDFLQRFRVTVLDLEKKTITWSEEGLDGKKEGKLASQLQRLDLTGTEGRYALKSIDSSECTPSWGSAVKDCSQNVDIVCAALNGNEGALCQRRVPEKCYGTLWGTP